MLRTVHRQSRQALWISCEPEFALNQCFAPCTGKADRHFGFRASQS